MKWSTQWQVEWELEADWSGLVGCQSTARGSKITNFKILGSVKGFKRT